MLYEHIAKPENVCRFKFHTHSIAFWDNHRTQQCAVNGYHALRITHYALRITHYASGNDRA
jgi:taurine dioxygenase